MIRTTVIVFLTVAAVTALVIGRISYYRGVPDNALWISSLGDEAGLQCAVVRGTVHVVYTAPLDQPRVAEYRAAFAGFSVKETTVGLMLARGLGIPFWFLCLMFAAYPTGALVRGPLLRWHRSAHGKCVRCGYNLTGNISGVCSECGLAVPTTPVRGVRWMAAARRLVAFRPRRPALAGLSVAAGGVSALFFYSYITSIEHTTRSRNVATLVDSGTLFVRYEPTDYNSPPGDVTREDSVIDLGCVLFARTYERASDGTSRASAPFVVDVELDLWLPLVLFGTYPAVTMFVKPLLRRLR